MPPFQPDTERGTSSGRPPAAARETQNRGVTHGRPRSAQRATPRDASARAQTGAPEGVALTVRRAMHIRAPSVSLLKLYLKPSFRGQVEAQFGASNPQVELISRSGGTDIEFNQQVEGAIVAGIAIRIDHQQTAAVHRLRDTVIHGGPIAEAFRRALGNFLAVRCSIRNWELEAIIPPEVQINYERPSVTVAFVRVTGEWQRQVFETRIHGIPARITLTGQIEFEVGLKALGWRDLIRAVAARSGQTAAVAGTERLGTQLGVRLLNGLLGAAVPTIVVTGTLVVTFSTDYLWARYITYLRDEGERRGLANQFANGFIRRIFHPEHPDRWLFNRPTGRLLEVRRAGIAVAERYLRHTPNDLLQMIVYRELDYHRMRGATVDDLIFRLGESLYRRRRLGDDPFLMAPPEAIKQRPVRKASAEQTQAARMP